MSVPDIATLRQRANTIISRAGSGQMRAMLAGICAAKNTGDPLPSDSTGQQLITECQQIIDQADSDALAIFVREFMEFVENGGGGGGSGPPVFTGPNPGSGTESVGYSAQIRATGQFPMSFTVIAGSLPTGLSISSSGTISGIATVGGTYSFTVQASNALGTATQDFEIIIQGVAPFFGTNVFFAYGAVNNPLFTPDGIATLPYSDFGPYGRNEPVPYLGTPPITWTVSSGALPDGVTLNSSTGHLIGFPNNPAQVPGAFEVFSYTLKGQNAWGSYFLGIELQILHEGSPVP